jgi:very-short-patch-repair endonuclease
VSGKRGLLVSYRLELDVWIPSLNSAIEFDGTYWHKDPVAKRRDAKKNKQCKAAGIALMRVPEIEFARNKKTVFDAIDVFLTNCASSALSAPKTKISVLDNRAVAC